MHEPLVRHRKGPASDSATLPWDTTLNIAVDESNPAGRSLIPTLAAARVCRHLPEVRRIRIDINGCLAGSPSCVPEAMVEYAVGWAFANKFFAMPSELGRISSTRNGVSIMVESGADLDRRRYEAIGWIDDGDRAVQLSHGDALSGRSPRAVSFIEDLDLLMVCERVYGRFDVDGSRFGFVHAALVTGDEIVCVARDLTPEAAATKIVGWALRGNMDLTSSLLVMRGVVDAPLIHAVARAGLSIVVTDMVPTRSAVAMAGTTCTTILGLALSHRRALFANGGHIGVST
ncbi:MAG: hypothetical protein AVDCRST_MAG87-3615 [uncultured Thermomicrobiales bacterium]|uniref:Sulfur carrier protein FdhD n=1 Tax=uncultured Thermomicrobiales bacterium TaxID=1645740 RepID=A0A6J4VR25_9BACT|nr:MAG: hypothetical protein AVDCRST_MAG87-3615 [uncultured Thermomicrobiales bacterium]